jgi:oxepin-CoA hydrolase/3-oxo-5,6-dehydrosuberyl-CoA semialdehyde dehydrogenase
MERLQSYLADEWRAGTGAAASLFNPTTEEVLAEVSSGGLDMNAALRHARERGGPALRALTFGERGALLKSLSAAIHQHRDELIEISIRNAGTTRGDAKFDIDGATGTLAAYAQWGETLGKQRFLADGEGMQLGRNPRFWGQHIFVPRLGAAVHINAFNFPAWNMLEKASCALLAGAPVIEKPGTPTAMVAFRIAQIIVASGILPKGAYQFIAGSAGDLLDRMGPQDSLAFTGSSATAAKLRGNANLIRNNIRVNVEADSLNAAVLGPDVEQGSETWNLFLNSVVTDMTQKAGQKCTAVRRVFVTKDRWQEVRDELVDALARVKVGDPAESDTRMGPLASKSQLTDVRAGIDKLAAATEVVCGGSKALRDKGYFVSPTLCCVSDPRAAAVHAEEVFGPVATMVPYSGAPEELCDLAALGGGSLVSSVYSNDPAWSEKVILGLGPWHGRVWSASDKAAEAALAPGMVLPGLIHGGPGRAGGGEELGGMRGLAFYLQRVAVQGFKGHIESSFAQKT